MTVLLEEYLREASPIKRLSMLARMSLNKESIPIDLFADLLELDLPLSEFELMLKVVEKDKSTVFEKLLCEQISVVESERAVLYLHAWADMTQHIYSDQLLENILKPHTSQRLRYTLLVHAQHFDSINLLNQIYSLDGIHEYSDAFHALLLEQSQRFDYCKSDSLKLARNKLKVLETNPYPENKSLLPAIMYLSRYSQEDLVVASSWCLSLSWRDVIEENINQQTNFKLSKSKNIKQFLKNWPKLVMRHQLAIEDLHALLSVWCSSAEEQANISLENLLAGVQREKLCQAYDLLSESEKKLVYTNVQGFLEQKYKNSNEPVIDFIFPNSERRRLLRYLNHNEGSITDLTISPWAEVARCYQDHSDASLELLANVLRQYPGVFKQVILKSFVCFKGNDQAVLKILDSLHTEHRYEQLAIIDSLLAIGTPRAAQELFNLVGRSNVDEDLKLKIVKSLRHFNLDSLQKQIRNLIHEIDSSTMNHETKVEMHELMMAYLHHKDVVHQEQDNNDTQILQKLSSLFPNFNQYSMEVKRALRTGMFFYDKAQSSKGAGIDLSPVIDMQYKAMEIFLRESFQQDCDSLIRDGILQRKLDVLGYSRPIPEKMQLFENYLGSLPIVSEIPYFSKFKLRKMLISLCQFRPTNRFTLDGIKAFSLFFLCFARRECRFGLSGLFPLAFANDQSLFEFCRDMHAFQDFRNRAVHEGLPPGTENNIESTWKDTARILSEISRLNEVMRVIKSHEITSLTPRPVITRKGA